MLPLPQHFWVDPVRVSLSSAMPALLQGSQTAQHQHTDMFLLLLPPSPPQLNNLKCFAHLGSETLRPCRVSQKRSQ